MFLVHTEHVSFHAFCDVISGLPGRYGAYTPSIEHALRFQN